MAKIARIWDGTEWVELASSLVNYPDQTGNSGKFLTTDGTSVSWSPISASGTPLNVPDTIVSRDSESSFDISAIDFDTTNSLSNVTARLRWDAEEGTLDLGMNDNVVQSIGMEFFMPPTKNDSGEDIPNGSFVMATGSQGDRITIAKAVTDGSVDPEYMIGIATQTILNGSETGLITTNGTVRDVDTDAWDVGTILYPDPLNPGGLTDVKPSSPNIRTAIAIVLRKQENAGRIYVRMTNSHVLSDTQDLNISSAQNNNILIYNSSTSLWENYNPLLLIQSIDGANSGIDADLLDGQQGSYYLDTSSSSQTKDGDLIITGNLTVNGTTTTVNSTTVSIDDKNIELGSVDTPTDTTADGGGITLKGTTDKTINWVESTSSWTLSENLDLESGKVIKIGGVAVLSANQYGGNAATVTNGVYETGIYENPTWIDSLEWSKIIGTPNNLIDYGIVDMSLAKTQLGLENVENVALSTWAGSGNITTVGTITTGTWQGSVIDSTYLDSNLATVNSPTFTGTVSLPSSTLIGAVNSTEISYLEGVTSSIQTQLNAKLTSSVAATTYAPINSPSFTGTVDFSSSSVVGIDVLPSQTGNSGKYLTTDGTNPSWSELNGSTYSADAPTSPSVGEIWVESDVDIESYEPHQYVKWSKVLTTSQSVFSGVSGNGILLEYTPGFEQVYLNGILLLRSVDYIATNGSEITLSSAAIIGDVIEIIALNVFNVANVYTQSEVDNLLSNYSTSDTIDNEQLLSIAGAI